MYAGTKMTGGMKYAFTCTMPHTSGGSSYATRLACVATQPLMNVTYALCGWASKPLPDPVTIRNMYLRLSK
jgi:hypothetical protein